MSKREKMVGLSAFILIILLVVLIAPANAGVSPKEGRAIGDANASAFIGETNLRFVNGTGASIPSGKLKSTWEGSNINIPFGTPFDSSSKAVKDNLIEGDYEVIGDNGINTRVTFYSPANWLTVITKVNGEEFSWVTKGDNITFNATTKLYVIAHSSQPENTISYKLIDKRNERLYTVKGVSLSNIDINDIGESSIGINTTNLDWGVYKLSIETNPDTNNGLDAEGPTVTFEVRSKGVEIVADLTAEEKEKGKALGDVIGFTINTMPYTNVTVAVTRGIASAVQFIAVPEYTVYEISEHGIFGKSDKKGVFNLKAQFNATGYYEITATEHSTNTFDDTNVEIIREKVTLAIVPAKELYYIGDELTIKGTVPDKNNNVVIKIDGALFAKISVNEFVNGYRWNTTEHTPGSYHFEIWALPQSDPETDFPDAAATILLLRGGLTAEVKEDIVFVAHGDKFTIEGTVPGRKRVDILTIAPKGGSGHGFNSHDVIIETDGDLDAPGLTHIIREVSLDGKFETDEIDVKKDVDTGMYQIAVLNYGRDEVWGTKTGTNNLLKAISYNYSISLATKTQEEILAYLVDNTVGQPGSDDLLCVVTLKVENGFIRLNAIGNVLLGSKFEVNGSSNRKEETPIVVTVEGPTNLKPKVTEVKADAKTFYNTFEASFGTATAKIGEYIVIAKDDDEHRAATTLNIILTDEPVINFSIPALPTVEEPANQSDNESVNVTLAEALKRPVFKVAFIVAGLLVAGGAAWVILSRKEEPSGLARPRRGGLASTKRKKPQWPPQQRKKRL